MYDDIAEFSFAVSLGCAFRLIGASSALSGRVAHPRIGLSWIWIPFR